jgi:hypothetical protein
VSERETEAIWREADSLMKTDILASVPLGNGVFELVRDAEAASSYDSRSGATSVRACLATGDESMPVPSLRALTRWAVEHQVDLPTEVAKSPAVFADFVRHAELGRRVVGDPDLYGFVEQEFEVSLERERPRVEGTKLLFLTGEFPLDSEQPRIWRVRVDLIDGSIDEEAVPSRSIPPES